MNTFVSTNSALMQLVAGPGYFFAYASIGSIPDAVKKAAVSGLDAGLFCKHLRPLPS
jgi:hypothetical protein